MERYKEKCKQISEQIEPREEFMKNLKTNINKKIEERTIKHKYQLSKIAVVFFAVTLVSTGAFGKDFSSWISKIFSNTDPSTQIAIEHGYIQNVEGEYIEHQGIGIKVNSIVIDDNKMNIVFDIKGNIDGEILIKEMSLYDYGTNNNYNIENLDYLNISSETTFYSLNKHQHSLLLTFSNINQSFKNTKNLKIILNKISIINKDNNYLNIEHVWEFENIQVNNNIFKLGENNSNKFIIKDNQYLEYYKIHTTTTCLNIELKLKEIFDKYKLLNKENIYIKVGGEELYYGKDFCKINQNSILMNIPITIYDNISEFSIILELENKKVILDVQREES